MKTLFVGLLFTMALVSHVVSAQPVEPKGKRIYRNGPNVIIGDSTGVKAPRAYPEEIVLVDTFKTYVRVSIGGYAKYYRPAQFLPRIGATPYGTNLFNALTNYNAAIGSIATTPVSYSTGTNALTLTDVIDVQVDNTGASSLTVTWGGLPVVMPTLTTRNFTARYDNQQRRYTPYPAMTVIPGSSTAIVTLFKKQ